MRKQIIQACIVLFFSGGMFVAGRQSINTGHTCPFPQCPYTGDTQYKGDKETEGSDGYIIDSLHFAHPAASYDALDSMLFRTQLKDYEIVLFYDSTQFWDKGRYVGTIPYDSCSNFDMLMANDNR